MADRNVLLVEGKDDEHVFYHLLEHYQIPEVFVIKNKEGIDNLLETLHVEILASDLENLGIVVDADTDIESRWQKLKSILNRSGYDFPEKPFSDGTIIQHVNLPTVGIWIMPNNQIPGMLENFVSFLVPQSDSLWKQAESCVHSIPKDLRLFRPQHVIKAHLHTWLAWQEEPGTPMGLAITKRYLDAESFQVPILMNWIRRLFVEG